MKNKHLTDHILAGSFAFLFSICAVGCLITGWNLHIISLGRLYFWCGLFSILTPILLYFRYGFVVFLLLSVRGAFALWHDGALWDQLQTLAFTVSSHFRDVYNWSVIGEQISEEYDLVLILLAYMTAVSVNLCICRRKHLMIALPSVILPLVLCLIATDTLPVPTILYLLICGIALLLVTDLVRRRNPKQFPVMVLRTIFPLAGALALLFVMNPQETYVSHAAELQKKAAEWIEQVKTTAQSVANGSITDSLAVQKLNLRSVGPKSDFSYTVMRVNSPYNGVLYLRGRDYDIYTGTVWQSSDNRIETMPAGSQNTGTLSITTYSVRNILYTPYYSTDAVQLIDGCVENTENLKSYSYTVSNTANVQSGSITPASNCTDLPAETLEWAKPLAVSIAKGTSDSGKAREIADYVKNSASYDLSTSAMRDDYDDFAQWFLTESDTGYCIHFATAAAVLLRAAGIPARYVEGYMVSCPAGENTLVSSQSAHAWVEYYDADVSMWRLLEATPGDALITGEVIDKDNESAETETEVIEPDETEPVESEIHASGQNASGSSGSSGKKPNSNASQSAGSGTGSGAQSGASTGNAIGDGDNGSGGAVQTKEPFRIPGWVKKAVLILLALSLLPLQGYIRIAVRRRKWNSGTPNERAVTRWKQSKKMARFTKTRLPRLLNELAMKAKFSQHTITEEELDRFEQFRQQITEKTAVMPWYRKVILRWIFAVE